MVLSFLKTAGSIVFGECRLRGCEIREVGPSLLAVR
jgi:hypothetical protein